MWVKSEKSKNNVLPILDFRTFKFYNSFQMLIQKCKQSYLDQHNLYDLMVPDFHGIFLINHAFISTRIT